METILQKIVAKRKLDVLSAKEAVSLEQMKEMAANSPFSQISFPERLLRSGKLAVMAEVKRASPSKGDIAPNADAGAQGLLYAQAGAAAISCLTEPTWFKGTLEDMKQIRIAIDKMDNRPALLRKDFIVDEYQIYEARAYGADTLLLIVAALQEDQLVRFLQLARQLSMEPLVEVNNEAEMECALRVGARVIGINNRNLHDFTVDMDTTTRLIGERASQLHDVIFAALSGISERSDVEYFQRAGARAILVGEALMRAPDPKAKIKELQGPQYPLVKICGIKDVETAIATAEAGADFIGLVFAQGSKRRVTLEQAIEISKAIKEWRSKSSPKQPEFVFPLSPEEKDKLDSKTWFNNWATKLRLYVANVKPLLVGVFANNPIEEVNDIANQVGLDIVQLSGKEGFLAANQINKPTIKAVHVGSQDVNEVLASLKPNTATCFLLDTADAAAMGGTGRTFDWNVAKGVADRECYFLAGGLSPSNIKDAVASVQPFAVDVSSGVETDGTKDINKIREFINNCKSSLS